MTEHPDAWPAGTPCWVDIIVSDLERSTAFYGGLLGWSFGEPSPGFGGYRSALVDGHPVAGLSPTAPGTEQTPHGWSVYLATDDIAATDAAATAAGARTLAEPMSVGPLGSMGLWLDPTGSRFGAWQSGIHTGFDLANADGAVAWCDLMTADHPAAQAFYAAVFGYTYLDMGMEGTPYSLFSVPGGQRPAGGIGAATDPGFTGWSVTFQVADVDALVERVEPAGGKVAREPFGFEFGRLLLLQGPDGEPFAVMSPGEPPS